MPPGLEQDKKKGKSACCLAGAGHTETFLSSVSSFENEEMNGDFLSLRKAMNRTFGSAPVSVLLAGKKDD